MLEILYPQSNHENPKIAYCMRCGTKYPVGQDFCGNCGCKLNKAEPAVKEEPLAQLPSQIPIQTTVPIPDGLIQEERRDWKSPNLLTQSKGKHSHKRFAFLWIGLAGAVLIAVAILFVYSSNHYNKAIVYLNSKQYQDAFTEYTKTPQVYKDTSELGEYICALIDVENNNYSTAEKRLTKLGDYRDAKKLMKEIEERKSVVTVGGKKFRADVTELDLSNSNISDISELRKCKSLKSLNLSGNPIKDISALTSIESLEKLDISGTAVTDISAVNASVYILMDQPTEKDLKLSYGETYDAAASEFNIQLGNRSVEWSSSEVDTATCNANGRISANRTQRYIFTSTKNSTIIGTVQNSTIKLKYALTVSGTTYYERWSDKPREFQTANCPSMVYTPMVENCYGFTLTYRSSIVKGDPFDDKWMVMIRENGKEWTAIDSIVLENNVQNSRDIVFGNAKSFTEIVLVPESYIMGDWQTTNHQLSISNLLFAPRISEEDYSHTQPEKL